MMMIEKMSKLPLPSTAQAAQAALDIYDFISHHDQNQQDDKKCNDYNRDDKNHYDNPYDDSHDDDNLSPKPTEEDNGQM